MDKYDIFIEHAKKQEAQTYQCYSCSGRDVSCIVRAPPLGMCVYK